MKIYFPARSIIFAVLFALAAFCSVCHADTPGEGVWEPLIERLIADGEDEQKLASLFAHPLVEYKPEIMAEKALTLYRRKFGSMDVRKAQERLNELGCEAGPVDGRIGRKTRSALSCFQKAAGLPVSGRLNQDTAALLFSASARPCSAEVAKPQPKSCPPSVYSGILVEERLEEARRFYESNRALLSEMESHYGVPKEIAVGILTVETRLGTFLGQHKAFNALAGMAAVREVDTVRPYLDGERPKGSKQQWLQKKIIVKSDWAYAELRALLEYADEIEVHPVTLPGSIYGAIGISQFMPTNAVRFGVDGNGDGKVDLFTLEDAVHSMGNFMSYNGWRKGKMSEGLKRKVLYRYNRSTTYVNTVLSIAAWLESSS
jgi:membrane-bound lytic murein transglycosylase B